MNKRMCGLSERGRGGINKRSILDTMAKWGRGDGVGDGDGDETWGADVSRRVKTGEVSYNEDAASTEV